MRVFGSATGIALQVTVSFSVSSVSISVSAWALFVGGCVEAEATTQHYARQQGEARDGALSERNKKVDVKSGWPDLAPELSNSIRDGMITVSLSLSCLAPLPKVRQAGRQAL